MDVSPFGIALLDKDLCYLYANAQWRKDYELSLTEDLTGKSHYELSPDLPQLWKDQHARCLKGEDITFHESFRIRPNSRTQWVRGSLKSLKDSNGEVIGIGIYVHAIDSEERKSQRNEQLSQGLRHAFECLHKLFQTESKEVLLKKAVELPREHFHLKRTGLFLLNRETGQFEGTFGTSHEGETTDEQTFACDKVQFQQILHFFQSNNAAWHTFDRIDIYGESEGLPDWIAVTPLYSSKGIAGFLFNANGIEKDEPNTLDQETLAIYASFLGPLITELQSREALQASEVKYRLLFDNNPHAMYVYDPDSLEVLAINRSALLQYGYDEEELERMTVTALEATRNDEGTEAPEDHLIYSGEWRHQTKSGDVIDVHVTSHTVNFEGRRAKLVLAVDISELKEAQRNTERLAAFPNFNPNPVLEFSDSGKLIYQNNAVEKTLKGFQAETIHQLLPEDIKNIVLHCLDRNESRLDIEVEHCERFLSWSFFPIQSTSIVYGYGDDITEKVKLERGLRQAQKMESIGQLAGGISHDFNNILTIILGYTAKLNRRADLDGEALRATAQIEAAAQRAASLTRQLLLFSRKQVEVSRTFDLNRVVNGMTSMLHRILGEHFELHLEQTPDSLPIKGDPGMIEQVVLNLVVNARDSMPSGGSLELSTSLTSPDHPWLEGSGIGSTCATFVIADHGCGMDESTLSRMFEPFYTTKNTSNATGLGLSTVYAVVRQHGGWVSVDSAVDKGTKVRVMLPVSEEKLPERPAITESLPVEEARKSTILLVEDERLVRKLAENTLKGLGYKVLSAVDGREAQLIWTEFRDDIDLLFSDIVMPGGISGKDLADQFTKEKQSLKVILTSGYSFDLLDDSEETPYPLVFIPKPYAISSVEKAIAELLAAPL